MKTHWLFLVRSQDKGPCLSPSLTSRLLNPSPDVRKRSLSCSVMLYSSTGEVVAANAESTDANTYRPFRTLDSTVMASIAERLDSYEGAVEEGQRPSFLA